MTYSSLYDVNDTSTKLVKFGSPHCAPCNVATNMIEEIFENNDFENVVFVDVDISSQDNFELANQLEIQSIPVVLLIHEGENKNIFMGGNINKSNIENALFNISK